MALTNGTAGITGKEGIDGTGGTGGMLPQGLPKSMEDARGLYGTWSGTCFDGSDAIELRLLIRLASRLRTSSDDAVWTEYTEGGREKLIWLPGVPGNELAGEPSYDMLIVGVINSEPRDELFLRAEALPPSRAPDRSPSGGWMKNADDDGA